MSAIEQFSGFEVIRAAMEVEKNGHRFYSTMAGKACSELARELFTWLAQDEVEHLRRLKAIEVRYADGMIFDNHEEIVPYLRQFADSRIFPDAGQLEGLLKDGDHDLEALQLAIDAEDKFAAYFAMAAEAACEADGRDAFAWLAGEERRHAALLRERQALLAGKG